MTSRLLKSCTTYRFYEVFETESISIFKNGTAFFNKTAKNVQTDENGRVRMEGDTLPQAKFGTMWFSDSQGSLKQVGSLKDSEVSYREKAKTISDMVRANVGKKVRLWLKDATDDPPVALIEGFEQSLIHYTVGGVWQVTHPDLVERVEFHGGQPNLDLEKSRSKRVINLDFDKLAGSKPRINCKYLQDGLVWIPNYNVDIIEDSNRAIVTLRALVMNDAEDIKDTLVKFVVGQPMFLHTDQVSPLCDESSTIPSFVARLRHNRSERSARSYPGHSMSDPGTNYHRSLAASDDAVYPELGSTQGSLQEDVFYYTVDSLSVKKYERSFVSLSKDEVPVEHVYEVSLQTPRNVSVDGKYHFSEDEDDKVYHYLEIVNESSLNWTTGSAFVTSRSNRDSSDCKPISQDMITYTPLNGRAKIKLVVAPEIIVRHALKETKRLKVYPKYANDDTHQSASTGPKRKKHARNYVVVSGRIKVSNSKKKAATVRVRCSISGDLEALEQLDDHTVVTTKTSRAREAQRLKAPNQEDSPPLNEVCWELQMEAGEEKVLQYNYGKYERVIRDADGNIL